MINELFSGAANCVSSAGFLQLQDSFAMLEA
jgi:hypothetical protein